jgi:DNA-binding CsgD family transcriptional regulator
VHYPSDLRFLSSDFKRTPPMPPSFREQSGPYRSALPSTSVALEALTRLCKALEEPKGASVLADTVQAFIVSLGFDTASLLKFTGVKQSGLEITPMGTQTADFRSRLPANFEHQLYLRLQSDCGANRAVEWDLGGMAAPGRRQPRPATDPKQSRRPGYCLFLPMSINAQNVEMVALTAVAAPPEAGVKPFLTVGMRAAYVAFRLLRKPRRKQSALLTPREAEISRWLAAGKSDWEIGQILDISAKTVNYHVENIKKKCGVATRTQAVLTLFGDA